MPRHEGRRLRLAGSWIFAVALTAAALSSAATAADRSACRYFSQLPDDCASAEQRKYENLRGSRFVQIELFARDVIKRVLYVSIYNTTGENSGDDTRDSAPADLVARLDPKTIANSFHAAGAVVSPPLCWALDWFVDRVGAARNFVGLNAAWMGNGLAAESRLSAKRPAETYSATVFPRTAIEGFRKGGKVYLLDDPKGRTWVLAAFRWDGPPDAGLDDLDSLGDRLNLPEGWKFRVATLSRDLILEAKNGSAATLQDDEGDLYHLAGPGRSNFTP